jgi:hypothetical protein
LTNHTGKHASQTPHIERIVVLLEIDEQLWALEIAGSDADVVYCVWVIEFRQTPIDKSELRIHVQELSLAFEPS